MNSVEDGTFHTLPTPGSLSIALESYRRSYGELDPSNMFTFVTLGFDIDGTLGEPGPHSILSAHLALCELFEKTGWPQNLDANLSANLTKAADDYSNYRAQILKNTDIPAWLPIFNLAFNSTIDNFHPTTDLERFKRIVNALNILGEDSSIAGATREVVKQDLGMPDITVFDDDLAMYLIKQRNEKYLELGNDFTYDTDIDKALSLFLNCGGNEIGIVSGNPAGERQRDQSGRHFRSDSTISTKLTPLVEADLVKLENVWDGRGKDKTDLLEEMFQTIPGVKYVFCGDSFQADFLSLKNLASQDQSGRDFTFLFKIKADKLDYEALDQVLSDEILPATACFAVGDPLFKLACIPKFFEFISPLIPDGKTFDHLVSAIQRFQVIGGIDNASRAANLSEIMLPDLPENTWSNKVLRMIFEDTHYPSSVDVQEQSRLYRVMILNKLKDFLPETSDARGYLNQIIERSNVAPQLIDILKKD